jgi:hypothetical protein
MTFQIVMVKKNLFCIVDVSPAKGTPNAMGRA